MKFTPLFLSAMLLFCHLSGKPPEKSSMLSELDIIKTTFKVKYAPAEWKKEFADWDIDTAIDKAKTSVLNMNSIGIKDFQRILRKFFKSTLDYHVDVYFFSTESAFLPFRVKGAQGRYFLTWIDRNTMPATWNIGDEVLFFNDRPIANVILALKEEELGNPDSLTDQSLAEIYLTARIGAMGHRVPRGNVNVTIRHLNGIEKTYTLTWDYNPEKISPGPFRAEAMQMNSTHNIQEKKPPSTWLNLHQEMTLPFHAYLKQAFQRNYKNPIVAAEAESIGEKKGSLPFLGKVIWQAPSTNHLHAYLFKHANGKTIGFIRIPEYSGDVAMAKEFANLITLFQQRSDALVIDQMDNPGGIVFSMYALASNLSTKPLLVPTHRLAITQEDVYNSLQTLENMKQQASLRTTEEPETDDSSLFGYPLSVELFEKACSYFQFIIDEWNAGKQLTDEVYLYGIDRLVRPQQVYTKPILVLVNPLSISCGDFFPAILQDNKRAVIMGTKTAGAGGFVLRHTFPSYFGIMAYSFTASMALRLNAQPIENLGVIPDIEYELSVNDLQKNYVDYTAAIHRELEKLLSKSKDSSL
jgi:hypothetical protein